jgi:hypothetical protein
MRWRQDDYELEVSLGKGSGEMLSEKQNIAGAGVSCL